MQWLEVVPCTNHLILTFIAINVMPRFKDRIIIPCCQVSIFFAGIVWRDGCWMAAMMDDKIWDAVIDPCKATGLYPSHYSVPAIA